MVTTHHSDNLIKIKKFVKTSSRLSFISKLLKNFIFSLLISEVAALCLIIFCDFTGVFNRWTAFFISLGIFSLIFLSQVLFSFFQIPPLSETVKLIDYKCNLKQRLVSAWEFREKDFPFIPPLMDDLAVRLNAFPPSSYIELRVKRKEVIFFCVLFFLLGLQVFIATPYNPPDKVEKLRQISNQMDMMGSALTQLCKKEDLKANSNDISSILNVAEKLKKVSSSLSKEISKEEAIKEINQLKKNISKEFLSSTPVKQNLKDKNENSENNFLEKISLFYKFMDKLDTAKKFKKENTLRDIINVLDVFELKIKGKNVQGPAQKKGETYLKLSKQKAPGAKIITIPQKQAIELGVVSEGKRKLSQIINSRFDHRKTEKNMLDFYKNFVDSINNRGKLSLQEKRLIVDYFDQINYDGKTGKRKDERIN